MSNIWEDEKGFAYKVIKGGGKYRASTNGEYWASLMDLDWQNSEEEAEADLEGIALKLGLKRRE